MHERSIVGHCTTAGNGIASMLPPLTPCGISIWAVRVLVIAGFVLVFFRARSLQRLLRRFVRPSVRSHRHYTAFPFSSRPRVFPHSIDIKARTETVSTIYSTILTFATPPDGGTCAMKHRLPG